MFLLRKIGIYTFSAYLLLLMVLPCTESHTAGGDVVAAHSGKVGDTSGKKHSADDLCTPFCACGNCIVAVILQPVLEIKVPVQVKNPAQASNFYSSLKSDFHSTIWQPPQLV